MWVAVWCHFYRTFDQHHLVKSSRLISTATQVVDSWVQFCLSFHTSCQLTFLDFSASTSACCISFQMTNFRASVFLSFHCYVLILLCRNPSCQVWLRQFHYLCGNEYNYHTRHWCTRTYNFPPSFIRLYSTTELFHQPQWQYQVTDLISELCHTI